MYQNLGLKGVGKLIVHAVEMIRGACTGRHLALYCMATYNFLGGGQLSLWGQK